MGGGRVLALVTVCTQRRHVCRGHRTGRPRTARCRPRWGAGQVPQKCPEDTGCMPRRWPARTGRSGTRSRWELRSRSLLGRSTPQCTARSTGWWSGRSSFQTCKPTAARHGCHAQLQAPLLGEPNTPLPTWPSHTHTHTHPFPAPQTHKHQHSGGVHRKSRAFTRRCADTRQGTQARTGRQSRARCRRPMEGRWWSQRCPQGTACTSPS
jgi:hypothetical protein